jgi:hypothetical protein
MAAPFSRARPPALSARGVDPRGAAFRQSPLDNQKLSSYHQFVNFLLNSFSFFFAQPWSYPFIDKFIYDLSIKFFTVINFCL